jgi:hypothetical protein
MYEDIIATIGSKVPVIIALEATMCRNPLKYNVCGIKIEIMANPVNVNQVCTL